MLIYAVADIHGKPDRLRQIEKSVARSTPDLLVVAGDIGGYFKPGPAIARLAALSLPVLMIRGNGDRRKIGRLIATAPNIVDLHLHTETVQKLTFTGIGGTVPLPFRSRLALRERELERRLSPLARQADIIVAHPPPYGLVDQVAGRFHAGSQAVARIVRRHQPPLVLCGHIHESAGMVITGPTVVVNCALGRNGGGALITMEKGCKPQVQMV
jgi:Icc-related predicted phosphoesterase